ncbi:hypothetical protein [Geoglobus ahangari]
MYPYPREVVADIYVSKLGGFSEEIGEREVGINDKALEMNTSLIAEESRIKLRFFDSREKPYFLKKSFRVVGISHGSSAYRLSRMGEVVLGREHRDVLGERVGEAVMINAVESFRIDGDYSSMKKAVQSMREWIWKSESLGRRN